MKRWLTPTLACAALFWAGIAAGGESPPAALEEPDTDAWVERLEQARAEREGARRRVAEAERAYQDWRQRDYPRGARQAEIIAELEAARGALARAEEAWPGLLEEARRAGVPPGVLRAFEAPGA